MAISRNSKLTAPLALFFLWLACATATAQEAPSAASLTPPGTPDAQRLKTDREPPARAEGTTDATGKAHELARPAHRFRFEAGATARDPNRDDAARSILKPSPQGWQDPQDKDAGQRASNSRQPLTPGEKMEYAFRSAFLNPFAYASTAFSAAITEATEEDLPHKDTEDRIADFGSRWAIRFGTRSTQVLGTGAYAVLFKQDPRYRPAGKKSFFKRAAHAASRVFVTDDDEGNLEPNYSRFAGAFTASALANLWEQSTPGRDRIGTDATFRRFGSSFTSGIVNNIVREFLPDLVGVFRKK